MKLCKHCNKMIVRNFNKHIIKCSIKSKAIELKKIQKIRKIKKIYHYSSNLNIPTPNPELIANQYNNWLKRNEKKKKNVRMNSAKDKSSSDISTKKSIWTVRK